MSNEVDTEISALLKTAQILNVEDGDSLVLTHPGVLSKKAQQRLKIAVENALSKNGKKVAVLILEEGIKLSVVRNAVGPATRIRSTVT